ncbi:MAG TPA: hypothetical protein VGJ05_10115 [Fimbriiglobus sp.]|jgi:hypothetical protein
MNYFAFIQPTAHTLHDIDRREPLTGLLTMGEVVGRPVLVFLHDQANDLGSAIVDVNHPHLGRLIATVEIDHSDPNLIPADRDPVAVPTN